MSNEHLEQAKRRLHNGTNNEVARAQAEATLALAHEQRTANLIAFAHLEAIMTDATEHFGDDELSTIAERLGL